MSSSLTVALTITAIGMSLLFLALAFFYGLLTLMMRLAQDRRQSPAPVVVEEESTGPVDKAAVLRAAAIAVALARAEFEPAHHAGISPGSEAVSAPQISSWWMLYHQRLLRGGAGARRSR